MRQPKTAAPWRRRAVVSEALEPRQLLALVTSVVHARDLAGDGGDEHISVPYNDEIWNQQPGVEYQVGGRWSSTASGGTGSTGRGITLTWSIMPDGTPMGSGVGEPGEPSNLVSLLNARYGSQANWLPLFTSVFDSWSAVSGVTYVYEPNDDGAAFGASGVLGVRGDIRIGAHPIDGAFNVLAYNYFPDHGDMTLDSNDLVVGGFMYSTANNSRALRNVVAHEHGHGLGFNHVDPINATKLMEAFASTSFDGPQFDDRLAVMRNYGDRFEKGAGNNTAGTATDRGPLGSSDTIDNVAISTTSDVDFYRFTLSSTQDVNITLTPTGPTYTQGPRGGTVTTFVASAQMDMQLTLLGGDGTTVIANKNETGLGGGETISATGLAPGTYYVKVSPAPGASNNAQTYTLTNAIGGAIVPLTGTITPVSPDPRDTPVTSIQISFSEPINPSTFTIADLTLIREGEAASLSGATLTTSDNITWTLGNLTTITNRVGIFSLSVGTSIQTADGRFLNSPLSESWTMNAINGSSLGDTIRIVRASNLANVYINNFGSTPTYTFNTANFTQVFINAGGGNDVLELDYTGGTITPSGGYVYDGGTGTDTIRIRGTTVLDTYNVTATSVSRAAPTSSTTFSQVEGIDVQVGKLSLNADLNLLDVTVRNGAAATINASQRLDVLTIETGAAVTMAANGSRVLTVNSLVLSGTARLDLMDNALIVDYAGASPIAAIQSALISGWASGAWNGDGISSSVAAGGAGRALGFAESDDLFGGYPAVFSGQTLIDPAVLVRYTLAGDATLDQRVDSRDLNKLASNWQLAGRRWSQGDFNFDGNTNQGDMDILTGNWQATLPAPPPQVMTSDGRGPVAVRGSRKLTRAIESVVGML
ncbi:pre-peptidase C-terminal domain-containing protein [Fontivita pretiosa]|uniref:pre-peptidase C-terminal domain-containing protein n=1 Tax=Fontivita pretiosa TaxID=2989684 RepID=UPI003D179388